MDSSIWLSRSLIFSSNSSILFRTWILSSSIRLTSSFSCVLSSGPCWRHDNVSNNYTEQCNTNLNILKTLGQFKIKNIKSAPIASWAVCWHITPLRFGRPKFESRLTDLSRPFPLSLPLCFLSKYCPILIKRGKKGNSEIQTKLTLYIFKY